MSTRKYSEVQIIEALKQMEVGCKAAEVGERLGVSKQTLYAWKSMYGGLDASKAERLRRLEDENRRLKKLIVAWIRTGCKL